MNRLCLFFKGEFLGKDSIYNEQEILSQVVQGNQCAFLLLVEHYTPAVFAHVLTYIKNASRAEEITQDIFFKVWKRRSELLTINNFRGYLFVIICGNEDVGQMSAWYVLSALGFYQVNPSNGLYVFGSPVMDEAMLTLNN